MVTMVQDGHGSTLREFSVQRDMNKRILDRGRCLCVLGMDEEGAHSLDRLARGSALRTGQFELRPERREPVSQRNPHFPVG